MRAHKTGALITRLATAICLAVALSGCVIVPYHPWHAHYWH